RPFRAPFYPVMPAIALGLALLFLAAFAAATPLVIGVFFGLFALAFVHYKFVTEPKVAHPAATDVSLSP
ncbi:MAG: hypothetical protein RL199_2313, partial [Pseudomonadota bacterium]